MTHYCKLNEDNSIAEYTDSIEVAEQVGYDVQIEEDIVRGYDDKFYIDGQQPIPPIDYQNEQIRQQRQARYEVESDPLRLDYDEALAREQDNAEQLKQEWLASKDKIREELPYVEG